MLKEISPKLPMRNKEVTMDFYINKLGFQIFGNADYQGYLMVQKDSIQIHFFEFSTIDPTENYGQVYIRTDDIETLYQSLKSKNVNCTELRNQLWKQMEFSLLDPDSNLLTFGQSL